MRILHETMSRPAEIWYVYKNHSTLCRFLPLFSSFRLSTRKFSELNHQEKKCIKKYEGNYRLDPRVKFIHYHHNKISIIIEECVSVCLIEAVCAKEIVFVSLPA